VANPTPTPPEPVAEVLERANGFRVEVGASWTTPNGRTWTVTEALPFGRAKVRSGMRFGEMKHSDIRQAAAKARASEGEA
jgi:hypothetical protein